MMVMDSIIWYKHMIRCKQNTCNITGWWMKGELEFCNIIKLSAKVGLLLWFACVCMWSCKLYPNFGFTLTKSTGTTTLADVKLNNVTSGWTYPTAEVTISEISGKLQENSNFQRHFLEDVWSYRHEILHDN